MLSTIKNYISNKFTVFNLNFDTDNQLKENTVEIDFSKLPNNMLDKYYNVTIESGNRYVNNENVYEINIDIKLSFYVVKKGSTEYQNIIDDYIFPLIRLFKGEETAGAIIPFQEGNICLFKLSDLTCEGLNEIINDNHLQPTINFKLTTIDKTAVEAIYPLQVILNTPANGATISSFELTWIANAIQFLGEEIKYSIIITDSNGIEIIHQTEIDINKYTIPSGILTNNETYTWKVIAYNQVGEGTWSSSRTFTVSTSAYEAETVSLISRFVTKPNTAREILINDFIAGLKEDWGINNLSEKLDCLWFFACHSVTNGDQYLNWVKTSHNCTTVNSITSVLNKHVAGNQVNSYIRTNYIPSTNAVNAVRNSTTIGLFAPTNYSANVSYDIGAIGGGHTTGLSINFQVGFKFYQLNDNTNNIATQDGGNSGLFTINRSASNAIKLKRGAYTFHSASSVSTGLPTTEYFISCVNNNGTPSSFSGRPLSMGFIGACLTDIELAQLLGRTYTYLGSIGALQY